MRLEQVFYTRRKRIGLGVVAGSSDRPDLRNAGENTGARFMTRPEGEHMAEYVFWSDDFHRCIGVGVTPCGYEDDPSNRNNQLVHMLVPEREAEGPDDSYLNYAAAYQRDVTIGGAYDAVEIRPDLNREQFSEILQSCLGDRDTLADLLRRVIPVMFREKNLLAICLEEEDCPELSELARRMTWLFSCLIPVPAEEQGKFRRNLGYAVFAKKNLGVVNLAYVTDPGVYPSNMFNLPVSACGKPSPDPATSVDGKEPADAEEWKKAEVQAEDALPQDVFHAFADRALESLASYESFVRELWECRVDDRMDTTGLEMMYLRWRMDHQRARNLRKQELPMSLDSLCTRAEKNDRIRSFLYEAVTGLTDLTAMDLQRLLKTLFRGPLETAEMREDSLFLTAYRSAVDQAYYADRGKYYSIYLDQMAEADAEKSGELLRELWADGAESSCIAQELAALREADQGDSSAAGTRAERYLQTLDHYTGLCTQEDFAREMRQIALENGCYFTMNEDQRKRVSTDLGGGDWDAAVTGQAECYMGAEQAETTAKFLKNEIGKAEPRFRAEYLRMFLEVCRRYAAGESANAGEGYPKEDGAKARECLQEAGRAYLQAYPTLTGTEDGHAFRKLDVQWLTEEEKYHMAGMTLEELTDYHEFEDGTRPAEYLGQLWSAWCEAVCDRLGYPGGEATAAVQSTAGNMKPENIGMPEDEVIRKLAERRADAKRYVKDRQILQRMGDAIWHKCGDSAERRFCCSAQLGEIDRYSIWDTETICRTVYYDQIRQVVRDAARATQPVNGRTLSYWFQRMEEKSLADVLPEADLNRLGYRLWKQAVCDRKECRTQEFNTAVMKCGEKAEAAWSLLDQLQEEIVGQNSAEACLNYLRLGLAKDEPWAGGRRSWPEDRYHQVERLSEGSGSNFFRTMSNLQTNSLRNERSLAERLEECSIFARVIRIGVPADNRSMDEACLLLYDINQWDTRKSSDKSMNKIPGISEWKAKMEEYRTDKKEEKQALETDIAKDQRDSEALAGEIERLQAQLEQKRSDKNKLDSRISEKEKKLNSIVQMIQSWDNRINSGRKAMKRTETAGKQNSRAVEANRRSTGESSREPAVSGQKSPTQYMNPGKDIKTVGASAGVSPERPPVTTGEDRNRQTSSILFINLKGDESDKY